MLTVTLLMMVKRQVFLINIFVQYLQKRIHLTSTDQLGLDMSPAVVFDSVTITPDVVFGELYSLDVTKSSGPDCITPRMLKLTADHVSSSLSNLMNKSIASGSLPFD